MACVELSNVICSILITGAWRVLNYVWLRPKKLERCLRKQGLKGNSYRLMIGDMFESFMMLKQAQSKPINLSTCHDIAARVIPFVHQTVKNYGWDSFTWNGTRPKVNITKPEDIKEIFDKHDDFHKVVNPITTLLISGFAIYEGEKWARHRTIINPAFHALKLKEEYDTPFENSTTIQGLATPAPFATTTVLRLYPPVATLNRTTYKKTQLGTLSLPAGVEASIPTLLIHQNKELWGDDAEEFKPERFSEGVSKATKGQSLFFPFRGGPRICIGQNFAVMEVKIVLSLILQQFILELSPSYAHAPSSVITLQPQYGVPVILYKR
ncbi:hypothetical protein ACLB2K_049848 [Fragaria x ananassa]